jgi:hypothetical protein
MKTLILSATLAVISSHVLATTPAPWDGLSEPGIISSGFNPKLDALPKEGAINYDPKAWSGHWWPSKDGGINNRWNTATQEGFAYRSPTKAELLKLTAEQVALLSPSEKFDIAFQRYTYPLRTEVNGSVSPNASDWDGICHGWAPAAINHDEPVAFSVKNADGIVVNFGSSDIKALLSYGYASNIDSANERHMGLRCNFGRWTGGARECDQDLNAGAFHIILTNELGINKRAFVADLDRFDQVWNQPIAAYRLTSISKPRRPSQGAAASAVNEVVVKMKVFYVNESKPSVNPVMGTAEQNFAATDYEYSLELNSSGNIVGGNWISNNRPDFVWTKAKINTFKGGLKGLEALVKMGDDMAAQYPRLRQYTTFDLRPANPINCQERNAPHVNANTELLKVSETDAEVTYHMSFQVGFCANATYNPYALHEWALFESVRDGAYMPWQKNHVRSEIIGRTNTDLKVKVTFNKAKLFTGGRTDASFTFYFYPAGMGPGRMYFPWLANLTLVPGSGVRLKLSQVH